MGEEKQNKKDLVEVKKKILGVNKEGRPLKYENAKDMQVVIDNYFIDCEEKKKPYTVTGLALFLGFLSRQSFLDYNKRDGEEFSCTIKAARLRIEAQLDEKLLMLGQNTTGVIFNLKNNFKWVDKHEIMQETNVHVNLTDLYNRTQTIKTVDNIEDGEFDILDGVDN